jgi:hypothetical protein
MVVRGAAIAQEPVDPFRPEFAVPSGSVRCADFSDDALYIGGSFATVGLHTGPFAVVGATSGAPVRGLPIVQGEVWCVLPDGVGGWYVAGDIFAVGDEARTNFAHIEADGSLGDWAPSIIGEVYTMVSTESTVYIGGDFHHVEGIERDNLAALDIDTGQLLPWDPGTDNDVRALALAGDTVYVAGIFTEVGSIARNGLAAVDAVSGALLPWDPAPNGGVAALFASPTSLYVGGWFTMIGGELRERVAAFELGTGALLLWDPGAENAVQAFAQNGSTLYLGGSFDAVAGQPRSKLAAVDAATGALLGWNPSVSGPGSSQEVMSLAMTGDDVVAAGTFIEIGGQPRIRIAVIDGVSGALTAWRADAGGPWAPYVRSVAVHGDQIAAGGDFKTFAVVSRNRLAALDLVSGDPTPWEVSVQLEGDLGQVLDLLVHDSTLYLAGLFDTINGTPRPQVAAVNAVTGELVAGFDPPANPADRQATSLMLRSGSLYVAYIGSSGFVLRSLDTQTGALLLERSVPTNQWVRTVGLSADASVAYFAGDFTEPRMRAAAITMSDGELTAWDPQASHRVLGMFVDDDLVYLGGDFAAVGGVERKRIAAVDAVTGSVTGWNPEIVGAGTDDHVKELTRVGSTILAGGRFDYVGGVICTNVAAIDIDSGFLRQWRPQPDHEVFAIAASDEMLAVGGDFWDLGDHPRPRLAVFDLEYDCPADVNGDHAVDVLDLLAVLGAWGPCGPTCPEDINADGVVNVLDLLELLSAWGPC